MLETSLNIDVPYPLMVDEMAMQQVTLEEIGDEGICQSSLPTNSEPSHPPKQNTTKKPAWSKEEINLLTEMYPYVNTRNLAKQLNRTPSAVGIKASRLRIKKTPHKYIELVCHRCGKTIPKPRARSNKFKTHYCSMSCYKHPPINCEWCGKEFHRRKGNRGNHNFCSKECANEHISITRQGPENPNWKGGKEIYYGMNWTVQRRHARLRDKKTCQRCGITEKEYGKGLDVHHIIPFRAFGIKNYKEANELNNLVCLCGKCHPKSEKQEDDFRDWLKENDNEEE